MGAKKNVLSKRISLKQHYNIQKKVKEARRKANRDKKHEGAQRTRRLRKDPGIPNLYPFKKELMQQLLGQRAPVPTKEEMQHKTNMHAAASLAAQGELQGGLQDDPSAQGYSDARDAREVGERSIRRGAFKQELDTVIGQADVVIEVVDARDPRSTRCTEIEERCIAKGKPFLVLLNKVDLIPADAARAWLHYFRALGVPCSVFKAALRTDAVRHADAANLGRSMHDPSAAIGARELKACLHGLGGLKGRTKVVAALCGLPNVGKSSVINSLAGRPAAGVAPVPGFTRKVSEIHIDGRLRLLDSPGVVLADGACVVLREESLADPAGEVARMLVMLKDAGTVLRAFRVHDQAQAWAAEDASVASVLARADGALASLQLAPGGTLSACANSGEADAVAAELTRVLLVLLSRAHGKVLRGGIPDLDWAARHVVREWNRGLVPFYRPPPSVADVDKEAAAYNSLRERIQRLARVEEGAAEGIVAEMAPPLDLDALFDFSMGAVAGGGGPATVEAFVALK